MILTKTYSSIWPEVEMAVHHLSTKIPVKWYVQYIRFEVSMDSLSCAFFMDICLDCISMLLAMQLECKYFGSVAIRFCLLFAILLGVGIYFIKYWICNYHHPCRKLNTFSLNSDVLDLVIRKTCVVINIICCILPSKMDREMISRCCCLAASHWLVNRSSNVVWSSCFWCKSECYWWFSVR